MSKVLNSIVGNNQAAFIKGKNIHNHILLTYELIKGYERKRGTPLCLMQMDIHKAYDTVDWNALHSILNEVGFPRKFTDWIMVAVTSVSYVFNVNGQCTDFMKAKRGLRQGDPISPMLFVVVMECLNRYLYKMQKNRSYKYHPNCDKLNIKNLCFADDILLFSRGDKISVQMMMNVFNNFSRATGFAFNPMKCKMYCAGMDEETKQDILNITGFQEGCLPFRYLGVAVTGKKLASHHYMSLVDRIVCKIKHWTTRMLTYAGRMQLIKSVTFALTNYWL